jgi:prefoldin alpha subunit
MSNKANTNKSAIEQRVNELVQHSRTLELYLNEVLEREATVTRLIEEARLASYALQNISVDKENEALMPIGVGVYLKTNIPSIDKLLVNIGAGVTIEKTHQDTLHYIESRIKEFEIGLTQLREQKKQITSQLEQIQHQVNSMLQQTS